MSTFLAIMVFNFSTPIFLVLFLTIQQLLELFANFENCSCQISNSRLPKPTLSHNFLRSWKPIRISTAATNCATLIMHDTCIVHLNKIWLFYFNWFCSYVDKHVKSHLAKTLVFHFPCFGDAHEDSTTGHVSICCLQVVFI